MQLLIRHLSNLTLKKLHLFASTLASATRRLVDTVMFLNVLCKYIHVLFIPIGCSASIEPSCKFLCIHRDLIFFPAGAGSPYKPDISVLLS